MPLNDASKRQVSPCRKRVPGALFSSLTPPTAAASVLILLLAGACQPTLERRALEYEQRVNAGLADRVVELFADDATIERKNVLSLTGREALTDLARWDSVLHTRLRLTSIETEGDTVLADVVESNDWLAALGIETIDYPTTLFIFRDGLIIRIEAEADTVGANAIRRSLDALLEWALVERPQTVRALVAETGFRYDAENARRLLQLIEEWQSELTAHR